MDTIETSVTEKYIQAYTDNVNSLSLIGSGVTDALSIEDVKNAIEIAKTEALIDFVIESCFHKDVFIIDGNKVGVAEYLKELEIKLDNFKNKFLN